MATSNSAIKITGLPNIGNNIAANTLLPVVNMTGVPTTQKANVQILGNLILGGAGGANFVPAGLANLAYSVVNAAQPNITSVGTLTGLAVTGNVSTRNLVATGNITSTGNSNLGNSVTANYFSGDGHLVSNVTTAKQLVYGGSNVVVTNNGPVTISVATVPNVVKITDTGMNVFGTLQVSSNANTSNLGAYILVVSTQANLGNAGNVIITGGTSGQVLTTDGAGNLSWQNSGGGNGGAANKIYNGTSYANIATANGNLAIGINNNIWNFDSTSNLKVPGNIVGAANANFIIYSNAGAHEFTFGDDGAFYAPDNVVLGGTSISIGPGSNTLTGISNAVLIASSNSTAYIQAAITNVSDVGSADWAAYGHRGDDNGGWIDMGFNSSGYNGTDYTLTGPGDGSLLTESYYDGQSPGGRGGNLIIGTGSQGTVNDIIFGTGGFLTENEFMRISDANNALEFYDGGNITGANVIDANTFVGNGNLHLQPDPSNTGAYLDIFLTSGPDVHLVASQSANLIFGKDNQANVMTSWNGNVTIQSWDNNTNASGGTWTFGGDGTLTTPGTSGNITGANVIGANTFAIAGGTTLNQVEGPNTVGFYNSNANTEFLIELGPTSVWSFDGASGNLTLPLVSLGSGIDERTVIQSQRKIIPPFRWSAEITGTTPTVVYTVNDVNTTSMKVTFQVQHTGLGFEMFDVYATATGSNTYYTVSNRLQPPTIDNTEVVVDLNGSNEMQITLTVNSGAATCWVIYDATEFGISVD